MIDIEYYEKKEKEIGCSMPTLISALISGFWVITKNDVFVVHTSKIQKSRKTGKYIFVCYLYNKDGKTKAFDRYEIINVDEYGKTWFSKRFQAEEVLYGNN